MIWTDKDSDNHAAYLASETGQKLVKKLHTLRMGPTCDAQEFQASYRLGAIAGYEQAETNLISLSVVKPTPKPEPQADYGVKDKATPA